MIKEAIVKIVNKEDLTYKEAYAVMNEIMSGETTATRRFLRRFPRRAQGPRRQTRLPAVRRQCGHMPQRWRQIWNCLRL